MPFALTQLIFNGSHRSQNACCGVAAQAGAPMGREGQRKKAARGKRGMNSLVSHSC